MIKMNFVVEKNYITTVGKIIPPKDKNRMPGFTIMALMKPH